MITNIGTATKLDIDDWECVGVVAAEQYIVWKESAPARRHRRRHRLHPVLLGGGMGRATSAWSADAYSGIKSALSTRISTPLARTNAKLIVMRSILEVVASLDVACKRSQVLSR